MLRVWGLGVSAAKCFADLDNDNWMWCCPLQLNLLEGSGKGRWEGPAWPPKLIT